MRERVVLANAMNIVSMVAETRARGSSVKSSACGEEWIVRECAEKTIKGGS